MERTRPWGEPRYKLVMIDDPDAVLLRGARLGIRCREVALYQASEAAKP